MMSVDKLIERLRTESLYKDKATLEIMDLCMEAADALSTLKAERDAAIKVIFTWIGCPECAHWNSEDEWCEKHDRHAESCDGCSTPAWRGSGGES